MSTISWLPDVLEDAGLRVTVASGYRTNGRPGDFAPRGTLTHHTGSTSSASTPHPAARVLVKGRSDLPGPLCQWSVGYDGSVLVVSIGRANHAGKAKAFGKIPAGDGNELYVGCEVDTNGTQAMPPAQFEALVVGTAAIHRKLGVDEWAAARHADTSVTGKWDIGRLTTPQLRAAVASALSRVGTRPAKYAPTNPDGGPRGAWPFGVNHKLGFNPHDLDTWHDGSAGDAERRVVAAWQREISLPLVSGLWTASNDAEMKRRTTTWQKAVGLLPTGHPGVAEWNTGTHR